MIACSVKNLESTPKIPSVPQLPESHRSNFKETILEFLGALRDRYTYSLSKNSDVLFGVLWGLPIPFFSAAIYLQAIHENVSFDALERLLAQHPIYLVFALHPFLFAAVFGALGTMRARRDLRIAE